MLSLESEIEALRAQSLLSAPVADRLLTIERRSPMSIYPELRIVLWLAVTLIATSLGILLKKNIDQIGHLTLILIIAAASAACYGVAWRRRRAGKASAADDYLLLLAALLLSADVGYVETQYHLLDRNWRQYLLILAGVHGVTAYLFDSRGVLCLSLASLGGWLGVSRDEAFTWDAFQTGRRLLTLSALTAVWRVLNHQHPRWRHFHEIFDNVAAHTAMIGALVWVFDSSYVRVGLAVLAGLVAASIAWGIRTRREAFILYGFIYGVIGVDAAVIPEFDEEVLGFLFLLVTTPLEIAALFMIHRRWRVD